MAALFGDERRARLAHTAVRLCEQRVHPLAALHKQTRVFTPRHDSQPQCRYLVVSAQICRCVFRSESQKADE
jgi:hypothetical protein